MNINNGLYDVNSSGELISVKKDFTGVLCISSPVKIISRNALRGCKAKAVILRGSVFCIEDYAFADCMSLEYVNLGSCNYIGNYAFSNCVNLKLVSYSSVLSYLGEGAFKDCIYLTRFICSKYIDTIYPSTFENCKNLSVVVLPPFLCSIKERAFYNCSKLMFCYLPNLLLLTTIESKAFYNCNSLTSSCVLFDNEKKNLLYLSPHLKHLANDAFLKCDFTGFLLDIYRYDFDATITKDLLKEEFPDFPTYPNCIPSTAYDTAMQRYSRLYPACGVMN